MVIGQSLEKMDVEEFLLLSVLGHSHAQFCFACLQRGEGPDNIPDGNPETVIIGSPLDGTKNPTTAVGVGLTDITGPVVYQ